MQELTDLFVELFLEVVFHLFGPDRIFKHFLMTWMSEEQNRSDKR